MQSIRRVLTIYWPAFMAVATVLLAVLIDHRDTRGLTLNWNAERTRALILSPYIWLCTTAAVTGIVYAKRTWAENTTAYSTADKMITIWFLMGACWYHTGCDFLSGLLQVMPTLRDFYISSNAVHLHPMHHPARAYIDAVYYLEILVQTPLCILTYLLYLRRSAIRPVVEASLCALHFAGTVAFYIPNLLAGETTHPILSNLDRCIGMLWIIIPIVLTVRAARQVAAAAQRHDGQDHGSHVVSPLSHTRSPPIPAGNVT